MSQASEGCISFAYKLFIKANSGNTFFVNPCDVFKHVCHLHVEVVFAKCQRRFRVLNLLCLYCLIGFCFSYLTLIYSVQDKNIYFD